MPEWAPEGTPESDRDNCRVLVQQYDGTTVDSIADLITRETKGRKGRDLKRYVRAISIIRAVIDNDGRPLFEESMSDINWLMARPMTETNKIMKALRELNGGEDLEEDIEEDFAEDPNSSSTTGSLSLSDEL